MLKEAIDFIKLLFSNKGEYDKFAEKYDSLYDNIAKRLSDVEQAEKLCQQENLRLRQEQINLQSKMMQMDSDLILFQAAVFDPPLPCWIKTVDSVMKDLNQAYEDTFLKGIGKTRKDYQGLTDEQFWGSVGYAEIGKTYMEHDRLVIEEKKVIDLMERVIVNGIEEKYRIIKYPLMFKHMCIGVGGIAINPKR